MVILYPSYDSILVGQDCAEVLAHALHNLPVGGGEEGLLQGVAEGREAGEGAARGHVQEGVEEGAPQWVPVPATKKFLVFNIEVFKIKFSRK